MFTGSLWAWTAGANARTAAFRATGAVPARIWRAALSGLIAYAPGAAPTCPTLVLGGDRDSVFSKKEQEELAASIPGARIEIVTGIGHALHWEEPERFVASLARFIGDKH